LRRTLVLSVLCAAKRNISLYFNNRIN